MKNNGLLFALALFLAPLLGACEHGIVEAEFDRVTFANRLPFPVEIIDEAGRPYSVKGRDGSRLTEIPPWTVGQVSLSLEVRNNCQQHSGWYEGCQYKTTTVAYARVTVPTKHGLVTTLTSPCVMRLAEGDLTAFQITSFGDQVVCEVDVNGRGALY